MPTYEHECKECKHLWDDFYKMTDPVPDVCPKCGTKGKVKRLISFVSGKVNLSGRELMSSLKKEGKDMAKDIMKSESKISDFYGI